VKPPGRKVGKPISLSKDLKSFRRHISDPVGPELSTSGGSSQRVCHRVHSLWQQVKGNVLRDGSGETGVKDGQKEPKKKE
jgi:hypothetical protein